MTPEFEQVQKDEQRLTDLKARIAELAADEEALGAAITAKLAAGEDAEAERGRRAEGRTLRADLAEAATALDAQLATAREGAGVAAAAKRMGRLGRVHASLAAQLDDDEARVNEAALAYQAAAETVNARYRALVTWQAEANALADRFGVPAPTFPATVIPAMREGCAAAVAAVGAVAFLDHGHIRLHTEKDEHGLRVRRTYREIEATEGYRIIMAAGGPKGWPELTERQRAILAEREREKVREAAEMQRFAAQADRSLSRREM